MKNNLIDYPMFGASGGNMASTITSAPVNVAWQDNAGITVEWTGSSPVGTITVEISNDYNPQTGAGNWESLDMGTISVSGNTGSLIINCNQLPFIYMRMKYTRSSGSGTLTAVLGLKEV